MGLFSAVASGIGSLAGSYLSYQSAKKSNSAAKSINAKQLAYNKEAAQNAHQWEVKDLQQAGLNPILSAGGSGANANPMTAVMPDTSGYQTAGNTIANAITTGADALQKMSQANLANAETDFTKGVKSQHTASEISKNQDASKLMQAQAKTQEAQAQLNLSTIGLQSSEKALKQAQASNTWADTSKKENEITQIHGTSQYHEGRVYNEIPYDKQKYYSRGVTAYKYGKDTFQTITPWAKIKQTKKK